MLANKEIDLEKILNNLYKLPTLRNRNTIQFSFATKLLHTIDNSNPIFDAEISAIIYRAVLGNNKEEKIESAEIIFSYLKELYLKLIGNKKMQEIIKKFRTKFNVSKNMISDVKILDFIIWSLGKLKKNPKIKSQN